MAMTHLRRAMDIAKNEKNDRLVEACIQMMNSIEGQKQYHN